MMSPGGEASRTESRGRVNVGSARDPAAGRSGRRSGRGGAPDLPIPLPRAPPGRFEWPLLPRCLEPIGARGPGRECQSPGRLAGCACRLARRGPECAPRASVVPSRGKGEPAGTRGRVVWGARRATSPHVIENTSNPRAGQRQAGQEGDEKRGTPPPDVETRPCASSWRGLDSSRAGLELLALKCILRKKHLILLFIF